MDNFKFNFSRTQKQIIKTIIDAGHKVYVVGGAIRDQLMGLEPKDIDLATDTPPDKLKSLLAEHFTLADDQRGQEHGVFRVADAENKELVDVAILRQDLETDGRHATVSYTDSIVDDLARRDLTINAMAVSIGDGASTDVVIDPHGGRADLEHSRIRFVGSPDRRIREDYLRMLRVARFATRLGPKATIDKRTVEACVRHSKEIKRVSEERVREEIMKALSYKRAGWMFRYMLQLGLLEYLMPDLHRGVGEMQNKYHRDSVFEHLCYCVDQNDLIRTTPLLKLSTLFHDIAKPHTKRIIKGQATFHNHEVVGASIAYEWMKKYKYSNDEIQYVVKMVRNHQWRFMEDSKEKTYRKWLQKVGKHHWRDLVRLRIADRKGNRAKENRPGMTRHMKDLVRKVRKIINSGQPIFREDLAINGDDLKKLGVRPGKVYKEIFSNMLGIVLNDPSKNTPEWLSGYVERNYRKDGRPASS